MKKISMIVLAAVIAGCASESPVTPAVPATDAKVAAAPVAYKTYRDALNAVNALRGKDKDAAAAAADQAVALAKTPDEKSEALFRKGDVYWNSRSPDPRQERFGLEALTVEGITPARRGSSVRDLIVKCYNAQGEAGLEKAGKLVAETRARPEYTNAFWIVHIETALADFEFDRFRVAEAEARAAALEKVPGVNFTDVIRARASLAAKKGDLAGAVKQYDRILTGAVAGNRWTAFAESLGLLWRDNRVKDVLALLDRVEKDEKCVHHEKLTKIAEERVAAFIALKDLAAAENVVKKLAETPVPAKDKALAERITKASGALEFKVAFAKDDLERARRAVLASGNVQQTGELADALAKRGQYAKAVELYELWWPKQNGWLSWMHIDGMKVAVIAYWRAGKRAELAKLLGETVQGMKSVDEKRKIGCRIAAECFRNGKLTKADAEKVFVGLDQKQIRDGIPYGAALLAEVGFYEEPKMLGEMRQALFVHQPRNIAPVRYVANAPTDAGSWFASGLMTDANRNVSNQRIGKEAAERLITDVAVIRGGKEEGEGAAEEKVDSWFYVCYDEHGIHLLFEHNDPKIDEVVRGKTRPTDYEMYLAIGEGEPVYQFGVNPLKREFDYCPVWNSPHRKFRPLADYSDFCSRPTSYGFATAMNVSWELAYHLLPENGTEWPFEMIHWSRSGGVTWGGTDIWQVSNWGHWKFEGLTPAVKAKIHRVLMYKALARYNNEKNIAGGGVIGKWKDAELGDPEFYEKALKPLVEKLDAFAKEAEGEPDDATVDRLFKEAVPQWYDFRYFAAELRTRYLENRYTGD